MIKLTMVNPELNSKADIDDLMYKILNESLAYEEFWERLPQFVLLGIEELALIDKIIEKYYRYQEHQSDKVMTFLGLRIVPVHDHMSYIGVG